VRVFGLDPVADPVGVLSRIGYLSEENDLLGGLRVEELLRYQRAFYPGWNRCLRRGVARGVLRSIRPRNSRPLEGAEGAGRSAYRAGTPAGITRAG